MTYLLDLNALLALGHIDHTAHDAVARWLTRLPANAHFCTCAITEIGFVRVAVQARLQPSVLTAIRALSMLKTSGRFTLLADDLGAAALPAYVTRPSEITDGHLLALARRNSAHLATLDESIPDALLIA